MQRFFPFLVILFSVISLITLFFHTTFNDFSSEKKTSMTPDSLTISNTDIKIAVIGFYSAYDACLKNVPLDNKEGHRVCLHQNNFASKNSISVRRIRDIDPVVCSQVLPDTYEVREASIKGSTAQVSVIETSAALNQVVQVKLIHQDNSWKVDEIICPESS